VGNSCRCVSENLFLTDAITSAISTCFAQSAIGLRHGSAGQSGAPCRDPLAMNGLSSVGRLRAAPRCGCAGHQRLRPIPVLVLSQCFGIFHSHARSSPLPERLFCVFLGLKGSLQHCLVLLIVRRARVPLPESSIRGSFEADHSRLQQRQQGPLGRVGLGPFPSGNIGGGDRWCSHWSRAAKGCAGRRSRSPNLSRFEV
jgi:hypothetical protein